jgi:hypothetical protein
MKCAILRMARITVCWPNQTWSRRGAALRRELQPRRNEMHPEEVMKADLLSEIVLVTFGALTLSSLLLFVAALARS